MDARDFNKIETRAVIKFLFLQGKAPKEIHAILTETLACFLPGRAKGLTTTPVHLFSVFLVFIYKQTNSVALVRTRTIPTERPPPVGEVSANFVRIEGCHVVSATGPHSR